MADQPPDPERIKKFLVSLCTSGDLLLLWIRVRDEAFDLYNESADTGDALTDAERTLLNDVSEADDWESVQDMFDQPGKPARVYCPPPPPPPGVTS